MSKATPASEREAFERTQTDGTDLTWALRSLLWGYNDVQRHVARSLDLGERDVTALEHLIERPELGPADLAELLGISTASATVLVDRLENAGHLERHPHPDDRRRKHLVVTDHAHRELFTTLQPLFDALMTIDNDYDEAAKRTIESYLRAVADAYADFVGRSG